MVKSLHLPFHEERGGPMPTMKQTTTTITTDTIPNVVALKKYRVLKSYDLDIKLYRAKIVKMPKLALLEELLKYHEDFLASPKNIGATLRGRELLSVLEERAELTELKELSLDFKRKLQVRLAEQLQPESES